MTDNGLRKPTNRELQNALGLTIKQRDALVKELENLYKILDAVIKAAVKVPL